MAANWASVQGRGARRDAGHPASAVAPPEAQFAAPKAGFYCLLGSVAGRLWWPAPRRSPRLASGQNNFGATGQYQDPLVSVPVSAEPGWFRPTDAPAAFPAATRRDTDA